MTTRPESESAGFNGANRAMRRAGVKAEEPVGLLLRCAGIEPERCPDSANIGFPLDKVKLFAKLVEGAGWKLVRYKAGGKVWVEATCPTCAVKLVSGIG